jgi:hypothetical protein
MVAEGEAMPDMPDIEGMVLIVGDAEGDMDMEGSMDGEVLVEGEVDDGDVDAEVLEPQAVRARAAVAAMRPAAMALRRAVGRVRADMCVDSL